MGSSLDTSREAARWLGLGSAAGFAISVGLLPWARASGSLVGDKNITFWDLRTGLYELDYPWSLLGNPVVLIGLAVLCAVVAVAVVSDPEAVNTASMSVGGPLDRSWSVVAAVPAIWSGLVIFKINEDISRANELGLGETVNFDVGVGAWAALVCGIGLFAAAYISPATSQASGPPATLQQPPVPPGPVTGAPRLVSAKASPGWYIDPLGRHEQRYWDRRWTGLVCDGTTQTTESPPTPH